MMLEKREPQVSNSCSSIVKERLGGSVEFKNVTFNYGDEAVLKNISFRADSGDTVAIIGPTGAGKSSLVNLIGRYYDCTEGEVLIDSLNIKDIDINSLRKNVSSAMQDIFLFSDTVEGNIAYGVPSAPFEQVQKVANAAAAHEFIVNFPEGYDTIIGERGVGLSGGQKQRIALARALLKNPSILILDDTTSSVDIETEHQIHKTLKSFYEDRTTFIIAHRISTVKNADMILVLNNGKVVEQGRHEELIAKKGYYYSVFINQFGNFNSEGSREAV
jgi:ATP-binding cassette subfamily B protein